jgi:hypothetical protein
VTFTSSNNGNCVFDNRVAGQPLFLHSLNRHNVNPFNTFFLNQAAWADPAPGTYSTSKPYYSDFRYARQPAEQMGVGKAIPFKEGVTFSLRADFFNVFNRWTYPNLNIGNPDTCSNQVTNPSCTGSGSGVISNGFGYLGNSISGAGGNFAPRSGEFVARIQF